MFGFSRSDSLNKPSKSSDAQISDEVQLKVTNFEIAKDVSSFREINTKIG